MPKEKIKIELTKEELKELIAKNYKLRLETCCIYIDHYKGDQRDPAYTNVIVEGERLMQVRFADDPTFEETVYGGKTK